MRNIRILKVIVATILVYICVLVCGVQSFAHPKLLNVSYDDCEVVYRDDGEDEKWYILCRKENSIVDEEREIKAYRHISEDTRVIKYWLKDSAPYDSNYTWTSEEGITEEIANDIKTSFVNSMKKWNDVYYYSHNEDGSVTQHKIIDIIEGTATDHDISIFPVEDGSTIDTHTVSYVAATVPTHTTEIINEDDAGIEHKHCDKWNIYVNVKKYFKIDDPDNNRVLFNKKISGAHEIGHILGLADMEKECGTPQHHGEVLMGYETANYNIREITYKDIAGVAITRGFHTDNDHIWMKRTNDDGTIDLICNICNGVLYDVILDDGGLTYQGKQLSTYKDCSHVNPIDYTKILVASNGEKDFFKCSNCRHISKINIAKELNIGNYTSIKNEVITLNSHASKYIKIHSNYIKHYEFNLTSTKEFSLSLYDKDYNEVNIDYLNNQEFNKHFIKNLTNEHYYLRINNTSYSKNNVTLNLISRTTAYLNEEIENDILLNNYNSVKDYYYINDDGAGFYKFSLIGEKKDGTSISYPANVLKIYDDENKTQVMKKYNYLEYNSVASLKQNEDSMIVHLPHNGYFYLDINLNDTSLRSLVVKIEKVNSSTINLFSFSENSNDVRSIFEQTIKGDYFEKIVLKQAGKFRIELDYTKNCNEESLFVLMKQIYNPNNMTYYTETKMGVIIDNDFTSYTRTVTLEEGTYYIGYINKNDENSMTATLTRLVSESGENVLVTDPDYGTLCGSQINIIEKDREYKSYRASFITIGFTRLIYPDYNYNISASRLDYYWYSSNDDIAIVTKHGTVLGKSVGVVKIMAVLKEDPSKVFVKQFNIINDTSSEVVQINSTYRVKLSDTINGKFHFNMEKIICPYPWIQSYTWEIDTMCHNTNMSVLMNNWGEITVNKNGCFTLIGTYNVNNKYKVIIHFIVE